MFTNADVTLYNRVGTTTPTFHRTHLRGVYFEDTRGQHTSKTGATVADSMLLLIPTDVNAGGKSFTGQKAFAAATDKSTQWTLAEGDIVVKGIVNDDITTQSNLDKKYDTVRKITSVSDNRQGSPSLQHWEVVGL